MDQMDWVRKLDALKQGKLHLSPAGESGMTAYANTAVYELREYVKALEQGYRRRGEIISGYRHVEQARELARRFGKARGEAAAPGGRSFLDLQETEEEGYAAACLGYAILGMRQAGIREGEIRSVVDAIRENMNVAGIEDAAGGYREWCRGRDNDADKPEWVGPAAELKTEVQG